MTRFVILLAVLCLVLVAFNPGLTEAGWTIALFFAFIGLFMPKSAKETCFAVAAIAFVATFVGDNYASEIQIFAAVAAILGLLWAVVPFVLRRRRRRQPDRPTEQHTHQHLHLHQ